MYHLETVVSQHQFWIYWLYPYCCNCSPRVGE